jgi:hypothetical protein
VIVQAVSVVGALMVLGAYVLANSEKMRAEISPLLVPSLNTFGALLVAVCGALERQYGVVLLEGAWSAISAGLLWKAWRAAALK